jgi:peptidoglycan/LPS O-acetylase OafA/YrhL
LKRIAAETQDRRYRPDIDGLRAIAIVTVVLSHMNVAATAGGFIGVDIFFVISGYLLTGNVHHAIAAGNFSVAGFYERRIRRIFPALVAMTAVTSVAVAVVFPPKVLIAYGLSLAAAIFSFSNFFFLTQAGYFAAPYTAALLHTWSLGVEEQFYLVLPLCMLLAARGPANATRWVVAILGIASFADAIYLTSVDRVVAFFVPWTRAWELLLGSAVALGMFPSPASRLLREAMAALALLLVLGCLFTYSPATPFPGLAAVPPTLAAALLIAAGHRGRTTIASFLYWRPVVFIGVISYSLYLWHWPVIVFLRLGVVPKIDVARIPLLAVAKIVLSFALGALSWRYVERPFRTGAFKTMSRERIFASAGFCVAALSVVAVVFVAGRGLPGRFPAQADRVGNYISEELRQHGPQCFIETSFSDFDPHFCLAQQPGKTNVLLLGDSHANALRFGLARSMPDANVMEATGSSCPPMRGNYDLSSCGSLRRYVYDDYLPAHHVDRVILTEKWNSAADFEALESALGWFSKRGIPVVVIGPGPEYTAPLPLLLALGLVWHDPTLAEGRLLRRMGELDREIDSEATGRPGLRYASVWRAVCPAGRCREYVDRTKGIPMLKDDNHLTDEGATFAVQRMQAAGEIPR